MLIVFSLFLSVFHAVLLMLQLDILFFDVFH